jgi:maleate isomerase
MLTPSSNTVLEPYSSAMVAHLVPEVSIHFGRFRVTEISLSERALGQFDEAPLLEAAGLLKDAHTDVIAWNGTSGGWKGLAADRSLCAAITEETGIVSTTSTLALVDAFREGGLTRYALVTPYLDDIQARIIETFAEEGLDCVAERHLDDKGNFSFSDVPEDRIAGLIREVAAEKPDVITTYCTNFRGARLAEDLEREIGIPIYDTVSLTVWKSLLLCGVDPARVMGWGSLFSGRIS